MQEISFELIKGLPKVELHCHLDGSLRINTILDIAKQKKVQLPTYNPNELFKLISLDTVSYTHLTLPTNREV